MSDLGTRIRNLVDEAAPPIDAASILQRASHKGLRPRWAVGVVAGLAVLAVGFVTFAFFGWAPDKEPAVGPGPATTQASVTTVDTSPSTTSAAQAEAEARAQMEARRKAAEAAKEAARRLAAQETPYLGLSLPGWEIVRAGETRSECPNQAPLLEARQATYSAPEIPERRLNLNVISRHSRCFPYQVATSPSELGPPAVPPDVIDHGMTTVMDHQARIVEEHGVYSVLWLLDDQGSYASMVVFPGSTPLGVDEVIAITHGVVELTADQWDAFVAGTPSSVTTTVP